MNGNGKPKKKILARRGADAELNDVQRRFVAAYMSNGYNATKAAMAAGHSCHSYMAFGVQGSTHLKNPKVRAAIEQHFRDAGMSADEVVARLVEQAKANPTMFFDKRWRLKRGAMEDKGHLVKRFRAPGRGRPAELELHDGQAALVKVGLHLGLFDERVRHVGDQGGAIRHEFTIRAPEPMAQATGPKRIAADVPGNNRESDGNGQAIDV